MAISFSRPDPSSPAAVGSAAFPVARRGFDQGEVRDFLRMVAAELARLQERERFLENELRAMQTRGMSAPGRLDEETVTTLLGEEAARVLSTARDASTQIRERAEESATRLVKEAAEDASRIREAAMLEAARIREDAAGDAEAEIDMAKQQGRDMVNEAREYREKVLSELSRRRDAARAQIEQLLHGRDRLLNAFQRARIATDDVIGELMGAHDEPEFIIDLAPTTGPVPVVNPAHPAAAGKARIFDHEIEHHETGAQPDTVVLVDNPGDVVVEEIEAAPVEVLVEPENVVVEPESVVVEPDHVAEPDVIVEPEIVTEPQAEEVGESSPSNVVSLFGRGRRPVVVPEMHPSREPADVAPEQPSDSAPEQPANTPEQPEKPHTKAADLDAIFSKLRSSTVADVAEKASTQPVIVASDPAVFARRDEVVAPLIGSIARHLKRALADEQNRALGHLATKRSSLEPDAIAGTCEEQAERYSKAVLADAMTIAGAGAKDAGGSTRRIAADRIAAQIAEEVAATITVEFRREMDSALAESNGDRETLAELLREIYRSWKKHKIDSSVEALAYRAYGSGVLLSLDPGTTVSWMVPAGGCCSDCEDNSLGGAQSRDSAFPAGHAGAPAHAGCTCLVWPVRK